MARIARRSLRLQDLPLFSLRNPWHEATDGHGKLPLNLFEPRYVELARRAEKGSRRQFGYTDVSQRCKHGQGMLVEAGELRWLSPEGPVQLVASGTRRFRILSLRSEKVQEDAPPLSLANVQLLADRDLARLPANRTSSLQSDSPLRTILGQVYVQAGGWGFASYHFEEEDGAYISYESGLSKTFPPLDDGSQVPAKKFFEDAEYDEKSRTFRGRITWNPTWQGATSWEYEMVFSSDLAAIVGGTVRWNMHGQGTEKESRFGVDLYYTRMSSGVESTESAVREALLESGLAPSAIAALATSSAILPSAKRSTMQQRKQIQHALRAAAKESNSEAFRLAAINVLAKLSSPPFFLEAAEAALHDILLCNAGDGLKSAVEAALWSCWRQSGNAEVDAAFKEAKLLFEQEKYPDALAAWTKVTEMATSFAEGWSQRAMAHVSLGQHEEAIEDCKKVLAMKPKHFGCLAILAMCHMNLGQKADAVNCLRSALAVHPKLQEARVSLDQIETQDLVETHLKASIDRAVAAYEQGELLPTSCLNSESSCSWDVCRIQDSSVRTYFFRVSIRNPSASRPVRSRARFYVLHASDGTVFQLTKPTLGGSELCLQPGEEHKFCWILHVGKELQGASSGTLLEELLDSQEPRFLVEELPPLLMLGAREVGQSDLAELSKGHFFTGVCDLRSTGQF